MLRAVVILLLVLVIVAGLSGAAASQSVTVHVRFSGTSLTLGSTTGGDDATYTTVSLAGCNESTEDEGKPGLPAKTLRILLPPGANLDSVEAAPVPEEMHMEHTVLPKQKPIPTDLSTPVVGWVPPDPGTYSSTSPYPGVRILNRREADHIGNYICSIIKVYPVDYVGASQELTLYTDIEVTLNYHLTGTNPLQPIRRSATASAEMKSYIAGLVQNPELLSAYIDPTDSAPTVDFAIIIPPSPLDVVPEWQRLADWKTSRGLVTKVVDTDWIAANFSGVDLAERIRKFINYAYTNWGTIFFLLGGDTDVIPDRKANWDFCGGTWGPTDLYYSDLDGDWNGNHNAQFGEGDDSIDDTPDVFVGRAPVRSYSQAKTFVDKVLTYEKIPPTGTTWPYPTSALLMGAGICSGWDTWGQDIKNYISAAYLPDGWNRHKLYNPLDSGDELLNRNSAVANLSMGYHLVNHADHCNPYAMGTGCLYNDWWQRVITRRDVDPLNNGTAQSILFTLGCSPNAFDVDSISEHFINNPGGGCVAYIGNSRTGWSNQDYQDFKFFESLFPNQMFDLGMAFASVQYGYSYYCRNMNLLGDPSLPVWTDRPGTLAADHVDTTYLEPTDLTITVQDTTGMMPPFPPVPNATVCLQKANEIYARGLTNAQGQVTLHVVPKTTGSIDITVWKHNYLPVTGGVPVLQVDKPVLSHWDHTINDGNGNGVVDAGETINMPLRIRNTGSQSALGVVARLSTTSSWITVTNAQQNYPNIAAGGMEWSNGSYVFSAASNTPDGTVVTFQLDIDALGGPIQHWTDSFNLTVHAPTLSHALHYVWDDAAHGGSGNGNGVLEPNETALVPMRIRNDGSGQADSVTATLTQSSPNIVIVSGSESFGTIGPRSEAVNAAASTFIVHTTSDYVPGDAVTLTIQDDRGHAVSGLFDFIAEQDPTGLQVIPGQKCMDLKWTPVSDVLGYHVYRKLPMELDYTRINDDLLTTGSLFHDPDVPADTLCEYRVTAVNNTRNESVLGLVGSNKSNPPMAPNWPREVGSNGIEGSSPAVGDIDGDGQKEVVICSTDRKIYVWKTDGSLASGWPVQVVMPSSGTPADVQASPALADLDEDGRPEIVVAAGDNVYAWKGNGTLLPGWPQTMAGPTMGSASIGDIDGDGGLEIVATSGAARVYAWHVDGTPVTGWPVIVSDPNDWVRTTAALADVNADGWPEVIALTLDTAYVQSEVYVWKGNGTLLPGWPQPIDFVAWAAPVVADIDNDGRQEIVVANLNGGSGAKIYCWHGDGSVQQGNWPYPAPGGVPNGLAIADIDGDGNLEIVAPCDNGSVLVLRSDGTPLPGWPAIAPNGMGSAVVADIDGDHSNEIIASCNAFNGFLHAFRSDGSAQPGSPYITGGGITAAATVDDVLSNGFSDIVAGAFDRQVYLWSLITPVGITAAPPWPTFMHDYRRTGHYGPDTTGWPVPMDRISTVKFYDDGAWVTLSGKIVTAGTGDLARKLYVEEPDRLAGIELWPAMALMSTVPRDSVVDVTGVLSTIDGERVLIDATITPTSPPQAPIEIPPLGMNNKALGGGPIGKFTLGVYPNGRGVNNMGLLVKIWGRVTYVADDNTYFYIDDGSGLRDGSEHVGMLVDLSGHPGGIVPPKQGAYVSVTGISSCKSEASVISPVRKLLPRDQDDIRTLVAAPD